MFKFLLYLFLFYFLSRFVFGALFKAIVRNKMADLGSQQHQNSSHVDNARNNTSKKEEKIIGEYVDYEEVK